MKTDMTLETFARTILFGTTLDEKFVVADLKIEDSPPQTTITIPAFPGRPPELGLQSPQEKSRAEFPSLDRLSDPKTRGEVLHFFANHELLAMELMALALLKFPDAPPSFRLGLARTIQEEQTHLRLYIDRMRELGVQFGDLPVSDYFWKSMSPMRSPLEFITQMSLTFEQANLDFSLFYRDAIA